MHAAVASRIRAVHLHFDINKTILMSDTASKKGREMIQVELASMHPGLEVDWSGSGTKESYYDYVCSYAKRGFPPNEFQERRNAMLSDFLAQIRLKGSLEQAQRAQAVFAHLEDKLEGIQPSFRLFWARLFANRQKWDANLIVFFRTMGSDLERILPDLEQLAQEVGLPLEKGIFKDDDGTQAPGVSGGSPKHKTAKLFILNGHRYSRSQFDQAIHNPDPMHPLRDRCIAINDDHKHWTLHGKATWAGKPLPIFDDVFSLFFDDNIEATSKSIVHAYRLGSMHVEDSDFSAALVHRNLIIVDPVKVVTDDKYFIDVFNNACDVLGHAQFRLS